MIFFLTIPSYKISCYLFNRYMYQRIKHARIQNWGGEGGGAPRNYFRVFCFVCLSGGFFSLFVFWVFFLNWRNSTYLGNGVWIFRICPLFPFSRSAHDKCKYIPEYVSRRHASWSNWLLVSVVQKPISK